MFELIQGRNRMAHAAEPIPLPWVSFGREGVAIRRGQFTLVAAPGGTGKTAFVHYAVQNGNLDGEKLPVYYASMDSDAATVWHRSAAMATGYSMPEVERLSREGGMEGLDARVKAATRHIRWGFKSSMTLDELMDELTAYALVYGDWPAVVAIDNISNLTAEMQGEFEDLQEISFALNDLARDTGAAVIALHHVGAEFETAGRAIPMSGIRGRISKTPQTILTLHRSNDQELKISVVKQRSGRADPSGGWGIHLRASFEHMQFRDWQ